MKQKWLTILGLSAACLIALFALVACPPSESATIKIGTLFAVTGGASNLGAPEQKTIEMLVAEINRQGGAAGKQIEVVYKDTQGKNENAISFAKQRRKQGRQGPVRAEQDPAHLLRRG
jgi:branched-chain amino acid transport system substrate-binding protein